MRWRMTNDDAARISGPYLCGSLCGGEVACLCLGLWKRSAHLEAGASRLFVRLLTL